MPQYDENSIITMDALEHLRKKSEMYLDDIASISGHIQLMKEAIDNSADEASLLEHQNTIRIYIINLPKQGTYQAIISDEGRGIPLNALKQALMEPRASGKDGAAYGASTGIFGIGIKATMAMSKHFCGVTCRPEGMGVLTVEDLNCQRYDVDTETACRNSGTILVYEPDPELMQDSEKFNSEGLPYITHMCEVMSALLPHCSFEIYQSSQEISREILLESSADQLVTSLTNWPYDQCLLKTDPEEDAFTLFKRKNNISVNEIQFNIQASKEYDGNLGYDINLILTDENHSGVRTIGAVNRTPIEKPDSHNILGIHNVIKEFIAPLIEDTDIREFFKQRYTLPVHGVVSVFKKGAVFCGQTKTDYKNKEFLQEYMNYLLKDLTENYSKEFWESLYDHLAEQIELAFYQYYNRGSSMGKLKNVSSRLWKFNSYYPCRMTDPEKIELFIAEGTSAGGYVSQVCDKDTQAVFILRGKSINSIRASSSKLRSDEVVQDLETVLGVNVGDRNLSTLNFHRIVILTDADADGHHITSLLISLFYRMNPDLLEQGYVYVSSPPLYRLQIGNSSSLYLRDDNAMLSLKIKSVYMNALQIRIATSTGYSKVVEGEDFMALCWLIDRIGRIIEQQANHLVIDPLYLEMMAFCVDCLDRAQPDTAEIRRRLGVDDVVYESMSNALILTQKSVDITIPLNGLVSTLKSIVIPELNRINWNNVNIFVSTVYTGALKDRELTVYQLYQVFQELDKIFTVKRYKGLGEMELSDLYRTAVNPETRTVQKIKSLGDVERLFRLLDSDTETRKSL